MTPLEQVEADIAATSAALAQHRRDWKASCEAGMFGHAEELEVAIVATERKLLRFVVRRDALHEQI